MIIALYWLVFFLALLDIASSIKRRKKARLRAKSRNA